ncbi:cobyric acid synthase [Shewanella livingstonensis]|uniref:Cobyric acid synthase n=1 Tax=Shewanella livingstonensis TaxID=150120 RepID=A0A3G8LX79_9GAMM|nr:cobyric acid synthase [Shewanella livingstonensis]AZG73298.1 cobyric acid synthase [Shewanella livingstonensis]
MNRYKLMVQGTTSDAGKSVMVAGLCRVLARKHFDVAPFKPQNMALNSAVTIEGGEIGRAQAVQAQAAGLKPSILMNPVLLKPNTDTGAQVIVRGKVLSDMDAREYHAYKPKLLAMVVETFDDLGKQFEHRIIEGAGSPAEINLRDNDIANMGFAEAVDAKVVIIADIDRGGVFAHLYGTYALLSPTEQARVCGFIINRFRGDPSLLDSGLTWLTEKTGVPVLGVIPYLKGLYLEAEDAINVQQTDGDAHFKVVVLGLPRISNHTDFDALRLHPKVDLTFVRPGDQWPNADLIIVPGSKSTRGDLAALRTQGWDKQIARHLRFGGKVIGICGGYQMLGNKISDPNGVEGPAGECLGLGYLNIDTRLQGTKQLKQVCGTVEINGKKATISGYEIHVGESHSNDLQPFTLNGVKDGAISSCGNILGGYLHGMFDDPDACNLLLHWAGLETAHSQASDMDQLREAGLDRVADAIEAHLDLDTLFADIRGSLSWKK